MATDTNEITHCKNDENQSNLKRVKYWFDYFYIVKYCYKRLLLEDINEKWKWEENGSLLFNCWKEYNLVTEVSTKVGFRWYNLPSAKFAFAKQLFCLFSMKVFTAPVVYSWDNSQKSQSMVKYILLFSYVPHPPWRTQFLSWSSLKMKEWLSSLFFVLN